METRKSNPKLTKLKELEIKPKQRAQLKGGTDFIGIQDVIDA